MATVTTAALLATGCGGGGSAKTLTKADLAKQADAICVKYNAKLKAIAAPTDIKSYGPYLAAIIPLSQDQRGELGALKPDDKIKGEWNGLLKDYDAQQQGVKQAQTALKAGNQTEFQRLVEDIGTTSKASDKQLDALGAPHCGSKSNEG